MKKSINAWSVNKRTTCKEMFSKLKQAGFDAVELNLDGEGRPEPSLTPEITDYELLEIQKMAKEANIEISSVSSSLYAKKLGNKAFHDEADRILFHQIHCAKMLGTDSILVVPGADILSGDDIATAYQTAFEFLNSRKERIEKEKVYVCLENVWNGFFTSPFDMASLIDRLDSPFIRAYYDVGNTVAFSDTVSWIKILGNRIKRIHIKDFKRNTGFNSGGIWADLTEGSINWQRVMEALSDIGYNSYLTAEVFPTKPYDVYDDFYRDVVLKEQTILNCIKKGSI